jgi:hypothetical protein
MSLALLYNRPAGGRRPMRYHGGAGRQTRTPVGNVDYTIKSWDDVVALTATLTALRTWTLPRANSVPPGYTINVVDEAGGISTSFPLDIVRAGADTVNGAGGVRLNATYGRLAIISDGASAWSAAAQELGSFAAITAISITTTGDVVIGDELDVAGTSTFGAAATFEGAISVAGNAVVTGAVSSADTIRQSGNTGGMGYSSGAGGTVTQATSKSTAVTLNRPCGNITTHNAALAAGASVTFTVNNTACGARSAVIVNSRDANYSVVASRVSVDLFTVTLTNITVGSRSEAVDIYFMVFNLVTA